ncbi:MAG: hypothetical protein ACLS8R_09810 [Anaeromassilibacillus sp.]
MLHFNAATEELFYPVFELLLRNPFSQPSEARSKNQADTIVSLQEKTFKMCSYLDFVYRFDDTILAYYWDKNITPEQQKRNAKSLSIEDTNISPPRAGASLWKRSQKTPSTSPISPAALRKRPLRKALSCFAVWESFAQSTENRGQRRSHKVQQNVSISLTILRPWAARLQRILPQMRHRHIPAKNA